jgi:hypothetical protein
MFALAAYILYLSILNKCLGTTIRGCNTHTHISNVFIYFVYYRKWQQFRENNRNWRLILGPWRLIMGPLRLTLGPCMLIWSLECSPWGFRGSPWTRVGLSFSNGGSPWSHAC